MIQDLIIKVNAPKPLREYESGSVLLYDAVKQQFFVTTREALFAVQDEKIRQLEKQMKKFMDDQDKKLNDFMNSIEKKFENFLETYQQTNSKLIDMVEAVIKEEGK